MSSEAVIAPNLWVAWAFGSPWVGFILATAILAWAAGIIVKNYVQHYRPITAALEVRLAATRVVADQTTDHEAQVCFVSHYDSIDAAMRSEGGASAELRHA